MLSRKPTVATRGSMSGGPFRQIAQNARCSCESNGTRGHRPSPRNLVCGATLRRTADLTLTDLYLKSERPRPTSTRYEEAMEFIEGWRVLRWEEQFEQLPALTVKNRSCKPCVATKTRHAC